MEDFDLIVIGAGPGGYVAAIRGAQLKMKVALVDKSPSLGGTCLNVGCIPSKALLESSHHYQVAVGGLEDHGIKIGDVELDLSVMMSRKLAVVSQLTGGVAMLMKKNKVKTFSGEATFVSANRVLVRNSDQEVEIGASSIVVATGSECVPLPGVPYDGDRVIGSTEALSLEKVPDHLVVVGGGAIGLELGQVWSRLGAKVTVVEMLPQIVPAADKQLAKSLQRSLQSQGMDFHLEARVTGVNHGPDHSTVLVEGKKGNIELECDQILVAIGRRPYTDGLGLEAIGVATERGAIVVDDGWRTSVPNIYAIGDAIGGVMLAHKASEEGVALVERLANIPGHVNYDAIPAVVYTHPELAQVGLTDAVAKARGIKVAKGSFLFRANGRALAAGEAEGMVKVVADAKTDRILGVHILGPNASELIAEAVTLIEFSGSAEDLARIVHGHPTLAEALKEAALAVDKRAIHS